MGLPDRDWERVYESRFRAGHSLVDQFYQPLLSEATQYDRLAGYLSLQNLADALRGIESTLDSDGRIRIIASRKLAEGNKPVFEDDSPPLSTEGESRLALIAQLMDEDRLTVKIGEPRTTSTSGIFHPKLGIATDADGYRLSFEGSINETYNAWYHNYERFKIHRSWEAVESEYVDEDIETFELLWTDNHPDVAVYPVSEAIEEDILDWQPGSDAELEEHARRLREARETKLSEGTVAEIVAHHSNLPGALHLAEDGSSISPWPHQRVVADTATSIYPESLLFCDEVGLGKTIEAGLTISRLLMTGRIQNALLLVPAPLREQWQEELLEKFNLNSFLYAYRGGQRILRDAYGIEQTLSEYDSTAAWTDSHIGSFVADRDGPTVVIASWHTARRSGNMPLFSPMAHRREQGETSGFGAFGDRPSSPSEIHDGAESAPESSFSWDLTLVDEAHHGRQGTNLYDLLTDLRADATCMYVLTATPMQLVVSDLFDLLRLCGLPEGWDDRESFELYFEVQRELDEFLSDIPDGPTVDQMLPKLAERWEVEASEATSRLRTWAEMSQSFVERYDAVGNRIEDDMDTLDLPLREKRNLKRVLGISTVGTHNWHRKLSGLSSAALENLVAIASETTPVQTRVFRNTRQTLRMCAEVGLLDATIPRREVEMHSVDLAEAEPLYKRVKSYTNDVYAESKRLLEGKEQAALGFVMTTYRQRLTSSLYAIGQSLTRRQANLQSQLSDLSAIEYADLSSGSVADREQILETEYGVSVDELGGQSSQGHRITEYELDELEDFIADLDTVPEDPKLKLLIQDLQTLENRARDTVVIFTQYTDTLDAIKEKVSLSHSDVGTYSGNGGEMYDATADVWTSASKERVKREFTDPEGALSILVCTDSASEGLNLQACDALINYDLPWNPMKVEQRIGRIDRIGQTNETVVVWNYVYEETVEEEIYERLRERIDIFERAVGPLQPILEGLESSIEEVAMSDTDRSTSDLAATTEDSIEDAENLSAQIGLSRSSTETTVEDIITSARLDGWTGSHPDVGAFGYDERPFDPLVTSTVVKQLFTQSQTLRNQGWRFDRLERRLTEDDDAPYKKLYRLSIPEDVSPTIPTDPLEDTVQAKYADEDVVLVSFSPDVLSWYPSVIVLLPHHDLFGYLVDEIRNKGEESKSSTITCMAGWFDERCDTHVGVADEAPSQPLVFAYASDETVQLTPEVTLPQRQPARDQLTRWLEAFSSG